MISPSAPAQAAAVAVFEVGQRVTRVGQALVGSVVQVTPHMDAFDYRVAWDGEDHDTHYFDPSVLQALSETPAPKEPSP